MTDTAVKSAQQGFDDIKLFLPNNSDQADSYMPVGWCVSPELRAYLFENQIEDPMILISVTHGLVETGRYLFPLLAGSDFVAFRHSGLNTLYAVVVWQDKAGDDPARPKNYLKMDGTKYDKKLIVPVDEHLSELQDEQSRVQHDMNQIRRRIFDLGLQLNTLRQVPEPISPGLSPQASEQQRITSKIAELNMRLLELEGKDESSLLRQIGEFEKALADLQPTAERIQAEIDERKQKPSYVMTVCRNLHTPRSECVGELDVMIPATMFGKSWRITKWLAGLQQWPNPARDNCQLRKRAIGSIPLAILQLTVKPVLAIGLLFGVLFHLAVLIPMWLLRFDRIPWNTLKAPYDHDPFAAWRRRGSSMWYFRRIDESDGSTRKVTKYKPRSVWAIVFNPVTLTPFVAIGVACYLLWGNIGVYPVATVLALTIVLAFFGGTLFDLIDSLSTSWGERRKNTWLKKYSEDLSAIGCDVVPRSDPKGQIVLPHKRRLVYVIHSTKARVCKPFEG